MLTIISGGQTGVDRAALDMALQQGITCGGWCPEGRVAEDGIIAEKYPLKALKGGGYKARTKKNVHDADGTVIIYFGYLRSGTEQTLKFCLSEGKSYLLIDGDETKPEGAAFRINEFVQGLTGKTINFAGPRASDEEQAYSYAATAVAIFIKLYSTPAS